MDKTIVTLTIDTEFSTHKEDMGIFGRINGEYYGVPKLLELLNQYKHKATFFVDVYTNKKEYLPRFKDICLELKKGGHDLELHTHPNGMFDSKRGGMKDYSLKEQTEIIKKGKEILKSWFGEAPIAHRAGDWGANYDTLSALQANQIYVDSSMFYGWENCQLNDPLLTKNRLVKYHTILELPASVFECVGLGVFKPYRLLSTDGNSFEETWDVLNNLRKQKIPVVTTVYHSFSFLKWDKERRCYSISQNRIEKFKKFLKALSECQDFQVKTVSEVYELYQKNRNGFDISHDAVPKMGLGASLSRIVDRIKP